MKIYSLLWEGGRKILGLYRDRTEAELAGLNFADGGNPRPGREYYWSDGLLRRYTPADGNITLSIRIQEWDL